MLIIFSHVDFVSAQNTDPNLDEVIWRQGLQGEIIYNKKDPQNMGIGFPRHLAISPTTGKLYLGQLTLNGGNILVIDPRAGETDSIDFLSSGLGFSPDGNTLYFGVSTLMLGAWFKQSDEFRKFAIIPAIESVQVSADNTLYVATSDFGPKGLYPNSVLKVDTSNARFEPIFNLQQASTAINGSINTLNAMALDGAGNIYIGGNQGRVVIQKTDGRFIEGNSRPVALGGINNAGMASGADGLVYHYDGAAGEVFAYSAAGDRILLAYGDQLKAERLSSTGVASDGKNLYIVSDKAELIRITAINGGSLLAVIQSSSALYLLQGTVVSQQSNEAISGVKISVHDGLTTTSDQNGFFQLELPLGLYELKIEHTDFIKKVLNINLKNSSDPNVLIALKSALPGWLAPGMTAEILANQNDNIAGATDVDLDNDNNLWAINHSNASITKTLLTPITRAVISTSTFAQGGNMGNAWFIASDDNFNIFTSASNAGVLKLPPLETEQPWFLTQDTNFPDKIVDQLGVNRMDSLITDVDGAAKLSNGDIVLVSGTGGSIRPNFPQGTFDSVIRQTPNGEQSILSRGINAQGQAIFDNPDLTKVDQQDRLLVANRNGNLVRVEVNTGIAELIWPGDGAGKPEPLSAYTSFNDDGFGNLFLRGASSVIGGNRLSMISPDGESLVLLAADINSDYGGFVFDENGRVILLSDDNVIIRIRASDGRTIAENLLEPPLMPAQADNLGELNIIPEQSSQRGDLQTSNDINIRIIPWQPQHIDEVFYNPDDLNNNVPTAWVQLNNNTSTSTPTPPEKSSAGNVWFLLLLLVFGLSARLLSTHLLSSYRTLNLNIKR